MPSFKQIPKTDEASRRVDSWILSSTEIEDLMRHVKCEKCEKSVSVRLNKIRILAFIIGVLGFWGFGVLGF